MFTSFIKRENKAFSRRGRVETAKKCTKKRVKTSKLAVLLNKRIAVLKFSLLNSLISYIRLHSSCILQGRGGDGERLTRIFLKGQNFFVSPLLTIRKNDNPPPA